MSVDLVPACLHLDLGHEVPEMQLLRSEAKSVFAARIAPGAMMETMMVDGLDGWQPGTLLCLAWDLTYWDGTAAALWGGAQRERYLPPLHSPSQPSRRVPVELRLGWWTGIDLGCMYRTSPRTWSDPSIHPSLHRSSVRRRDIRSVSFPQMPPPLPRLLATLVFTYPCSVSSRVLVARA